MYLDTIGEQSRVFLYSLGIGFMLGIVYDVFEFVGFLLPKKKSFIIVRDIIFMVVSSLIMFLFSLSIDNGSFRFHIYAGAIAGFFVCFFSLGKFLRKVFLPTAIFLKAFFRKFKRGILSVIIKNKEKRAEKAKKSEISSNLLLQDDELMLYNKKDNETEGSVEKE